MYLVLQEEMSCGFRISDVRFRICLCPIQNNYFHPNDKPPLPNPAIAAYNRHFRQRAAIWLHPAIY
jgi:hypothetical protein